MKKKKKKPFGSVSGDSSSVNLEYYVHLTARHLLFFLLEDVYTTFGFSQIDYNKIKIKAAYLKYNNNIIYSKRRRRRSRKKKFFEN